MTNAYDLVAIGAGPAGESAAELATFYGHQTLIIMDELFRKWGVTVVLGANADTIVRTTAGNPEVALSVENWSTSPRCHSLRRQP